MFTTPILRFIKKKSDRRARRKIDFVDWIMNKGGLESMNFAWAIMGAVVYKI